MNREQFVKSLSAIIDEAGEFHASDRAMLFGFLENIGVQHPDVAIYLTRSRKRMRDVFREKAVKYGDTPVIGMFSCMRWKDVCSFLQKANLLEMGPHANDPFIIIDEITKDDDFSVLKEHKEAIIESALRSAVTWRFLSDLKNGVEIEQCGKVFV